MTDYKIIFDKMEWQQKIPGIKFKECIIDDKKLRLVEFSDELEEKDWCTNGHLGYVIGGKAKVMFTDGQKAVFKQGDFINIPKGENDRHKTHIDKGERALVVFFEGVLK